MRRARKPPARLLVVACLLVAAGWSWRVHGQAPTGGAVVYGTDLGNGPIPPGIHAGEARLLLRAGLSGEALLEAMCPGPLAAGAPADVVALPGDPLEDPVWLADAALVIRSGRRMPLGGGG